MAAAESPDRGAGHGAGEREETRPARVYLCRQEGGGDGRGMLPGYADTDTGTRYGDTPIRYFSKNKDTGIRQYIYKK